MARNIEVKLVVKDDGSVVVQKFGKESSKSLKKASKSTDKFSKSMKGLKTIVAGLIGLKLGKELVGIFNRSTELADSVAKLSSRLGVSTEALQKLQFVAERSGLSMETMNLSIQRMVRRSAEAATGIGEAKDAFKELGFTTEQLINQSPEEMFLQIAGSLEKLGTEGQQVRMLFKIFDTEGVGVKQAMMKGAEGVQALFDRFDELNATMGPDFLAASEQYQDALTDIKFAWRGLVVTLGKEILPAINDNIDEIVEGIQWLAKAIDDVFNLSNKAKIEDIDEQIALLNTNIKELTDPEGLGAVSKWLNEAFGHDSQARVTELEAKLKSLTEARDKLVKSEETKIAKRPDRERKKFGAPADKAAEERAKKEFEIKKQWAEEWEEKQQEIEDGRLEMQHEGLNDYYANIQSQKEMDAKAAEEKATMDQQIADNRKAAGMQALSDASSFFLEMGKKNKTFFRLYQATAIAETIISTFEGAQKAFSALAGIPYVGPALGVAAAAAAIAAGMARVSSIASQKPGGAKHGAVTNRPTNLIIGEGAKNEAVVPLDNGMQIPVNMKNGGGGGQTVNVTIQAVDSKSFAELTRRNPKAIVDPIMRAMQKGYQPLIKTQRRVI